MTLAKGDKACWTWSNGTEVTRKASSEEPAYLLVQEDDGRVLKYCSELDQQ